MSAPFEFSNTVGYKVAKYLVGPIPPPFGAYGVNSGKVLFTAPPKGTWYFALLLTEYTGVATENGYTRRDWYNFPTPVVIGPPVGSITPQVRLWWNADESGTGYSIDLQHGVLVVTVYSYNLDGTAQWYLVSGTLSNNTVSGPLTKYRGGQCVSCAYQPPVANGNDGTMTFVFTSAKTATVTAPGDRSFTITTPAF